MSELVSAAALDCCGFQLKEPPKLRFKLAIGDTVGVVSLVRQAEEDSSIDLKKLAIEILPAAQDIGRASALIESLSKKDLEVLEALFRSKLFTEDSFGYVLMFEKPASMISPSRLNDAAGRPYDLKYEQALKEGIDLWNRVFADRTDFCFRSTLHLSSKQDGILLPNRFFLSKTKTTAAIEKNLDVFQNLLKSNDTAERIFERMTASDVDFDRIIRDDFALGILLGFGRENAEGFAAFEEAFWGDDEETQAELISRRFMLHDSRLEEDPNIAELHQAGRGVGQVEYAVFSGREEALRLKLKYSKQRAALRRLLDSEDFLERVVDRILNPV